MRIERINLIGFKSFSEKTEFNFHPGLTAIVGPNGCGKSNIVDAFKWVLGEQSAKSLRGDHMEDVIFTGSSTKKPKGMAEITLLLSGVSNGGSSETLQVSVTRRLYRSGESEYLINKVPCRLKDIKNMFLDTGLELKAYSILEQGRIDAILNSKPKDRRFIIEEVAGVMKYNVRKNEALQKLETSRGNLQRLQDIVNEVKRQINSIDRYAKKAQRYKRLFDEIKGIEIKMAVRDMSSMEEELEKLAEVENNLKSKETELSTNIHSSDAFIEEKKLLCVDKEKALDEIQNRLNTAEREFIEEEGAISLVRSDCENLRERLQRLRVRDEELRGLKEDFHEQLNKTDLKSRELGIELSEIEKTLASSNEALSAIEKEISGIEADIEITRQNIFNKTDEIGNVRNEISNLSLMLDGLEKKVIKNIEDSEYIRDAVSRLTASMNEAREKSEQLGTELKEKNRIKEGFLGDLNRSKQGLSSKEEGLYRDREELAAMISRAESLKELDFEGESAVKESINILCQVADIFEALPEHETAIEAVLGDRLSAAVVGNHEEIIKALHLIKEQKISRSGFIPVNVSPHSRAASSPLPENIIGRAVDFVKVKEGYDRIAASLLSDVIMVDNLDTAFYLSQNRRAAPDSGHYTGYFVTLDGEVLDPYGVVSGGIEKGVLKVKREIRELGNEIEVKKAGIFSVEGEVSAIKEEIAGLEKSLHTVDNEISGMEKAYHEQDLKVTNMKDENERQQKRLHFLTAELEEDKKEKEGNRQKLDEKERACRSLEDERRRIDEETKELSAKIGDKKTRLELLRADLTEKMLTRTSLKEKIDSLLRENERINSDITELEKKKEQMSREYSDIDSSISLKEEEVRKRESDLKTAVASLAGLKEQSSGLKEILDAQTAELRLLENQQKSYVEELTSVRKELSRFEVKKTELTLGHAHIKDNIIKIYSVDPETITREQYLADPLLAEEEDKLRSAARRRGG
jgi:chromosome segregation protein